MKIKTCYSFAKIKAVANHIMFIMNGWWSGLVAEIVTNFFFFSLFSLFMRDDINIGKRGKRGKNRKKIGKNWKDSKD